MFKLAQKVHAAKGIPQNEPKSFSKSYPPGGRGLTPKKFQKVTFMIKEKPHTKFGGDPTSSLGAKQIANKQTLYFYMYINIVFSLAT